MLTSRPIAFWFNYLALLVSPLLMSATAMSQSVTHKSGDPARNDILWTTLGSSENDSMPIGNGDLAANVWTEQNGDLGCWSPKLTPGLSWESWTNSLAYAFTLPKIHLLGRRNSHRLCTSRTRA